MMVRALTILETLIALVLLAALSAVATSWTMGIQRSAKDLSAISEWETIAARALNCLSDDLSSFDATAEQPPAVQLAENSLTIPTRSAGSASVVYRLDDDGRLSRDDGSPRDLLHGITDWSVTPMYFADNADPGENPIGFDIELQSVEGRAFTRTLWLHRREVAP